MSECQDCGEQYPPVRGAHPMYCPECEKVHEGRNQENKRTALTDYKQKKKSSRQKPKTENTTNISEDSDDAVLLRCDGACISNPSPYTGVGMALIQNGNVIAKWGAATEAKTNVEAEYSSIVEGLKGAIENNVEDIRVVNDNKLVVNQINRKWNTKADNLKPYLKQVDTLLEAFRWWSVQWVPREQNDIVDEVAKKYSKKSLRQNHPIVREATELDTKFRRTMS